MYIDLPGSEDRPRILELNDTLVRFLSPLDACLLERLAADAELFLTVKDEGAVIAFLIALREGSSYNSPNYRWFSDRYKTFLYIDRIVVDPEAQRRGAGRLLYEEVIRRARATGIGTVAAEIDIRPENPPSLAFHHAFGFREVGRQDVACGRKEVSLQILQLDL